jgi:hypothetical protein
MTAYKLAPSHPDVPRPNNDEMMKLAQDVVAAIERCGASPDLSNAISLATDLRTYLSKEEPTLVLSIDFEDETSCQIKVHGTTKDLVRLKTRIEYWMRMEDQIHPIETD